MFSSSEELKYIDAIIIAKKNPGLNNPGLHFDYLPLNDRNKTLIFEYEILESIQFYSIR